MPAESRRYINLPNRPPGLPFSDGVLVGDTLYISGRIGLDPATGVAPASRQMASAASIDSPTLMWTFFWL